MGNRILRAAGLRLEVMTTEDFESATPAERASAIELDPGAVRELAAHGWPGNFRELETVLERAFLLYRSGAVVGAPEIRAALGVVVGPTGNG
jgi:DNA-binding NtrC family response regulator